MTIDFKTARKKYQEFRNIEKQKLIDMFKKKGYISNNMGGNGYKNFVSQKKINPYDLSDSMWVKANKKIDNQKVKIAVYFHTIFVDPKTRITLAQMDKLSYSFSLDGVESEVFHTDFDLPLNDSDCEKLIEEIEKTL